MALTTGGNTEQLTYHLGLAKQNGVTEAELIEAITRLAFYAGWPKAFSAMTVAKQGLRPVGEPIKGRTRTAVALHAPPLFPARFATHY